MKNKSLRIRVLLGSCLALFAVSLLAVSADARVTRIEITERVPFAAGMAFGEVGPYEKLKGRLYYAVDPDNRYNRQIVDLQLAKAGQLRQDISIVRSPDPGPGYVEEIVGPDARNKKGEVEFWGDFILLKPVDMAKGNGRIFYEVNNRGNIPGLTYYNDAVSTNDPTIVQDAGNGWLMRQGYTILWTAWNWDVENVTTNPASNPLRIFLPIIVNPDGSPLVEKVNAELTIQTTDTRPFEWLAWGNSRCYLVADDPALQHAATLTVRDLPDVDAIGPRTVIPRDTWSFARIGRSGTQSVLLPEPANAISYPAGFQKGRIYEVIYWAKNPRVVGLGLAAIRDAISFFHFDRHDDHGTRNPLFSPGKKPHLPEYAYIFGISQSGRVINTMIYQGFHVDEKGRMVFEGARPEVPGGGKGSFNYRWAQTTHHPKHIEGNYFAADHFPFNFTDKGELQIDPYRLRDGIFGDVLAVAKRLHKVPKIMLVNHEAEYWTRAASLVHTNAFGTRDVLDDTHPNVRLYLLNGAQHGAPSPTSTRYTSADQHNRGYVYFQPFGRALLTALDRWVTHGIEPPPSAVPQVAKGELMTAAEHKALFPVIPAYTHNGITFPAVRHPGTYLKPPRVDYGPRYFMPMPWPWDPVPVAFPGLQDNVPPKYFGPPYETRVPAFDGDGNGVGGVRLLDIAVPLGTYQGWNPRCDTCGAPNFLQPFDVSFWPFALTEAERAATSDPRPSIEARYPTKDAYVAAVTTVAAQLKQQGFMLEEDVQAAVLKAQLMAWPPAPTNGYPFWLVNP